ncbi:MAG: ZIP family metal transporter [Hyphomicrobium sp.]
MNETNPPPVTVPVPVLTGKGPRHSGPLWLALPLLLLGLAAALLLTSDLFRVLERGAPPVEKLTFERMVLDEDGIHLTIRAGGSKPMTIAQIQVDEAYWKFTQDPVGDLARVASARLHIPYPWIPGEAHKVKVVTNLGTAFEHEIAVAVATPKPSFGELLPQAVVGAFVGILPVALGLMLYPVLRRLGQGGMSFLLALTVGLLVFLFVDTVEDALELAGEAAAAFQGHVMVIVVALMTFLGLLGMGRRGGTPTGLALATYIALGIGLHNLGEGLAIGAAFATGAAGLGAFLVLGFTFHNITEGIGIAAPLLRDRPPVMRFVGLALLAGSPAIVGMWLGSLAISPQWSALALAVGAGAILQVIVEVGAYLARTEGGKVTALASPTAISGIALGITVMYATGMLVKV